jgi:aspartyl-tRNA(Asn)/glutamyl-tRNA(Gln) amidotransferase subunit C
MDIKDVENLANLARIDLPEAEKAQLLKDMDSILAYVKQVEELDIKDISTHDVVRNIWREDEPRDRDFSRDIIIKQFPDSQDGFLKVKKIL